MGTGASKKMDNRENVESKEKKTLLKTLSGHTGGINCMDIADNLLLTGSDDRTARLWNLVCYDCKVVLEGHRGYINCCKIWQGTFALTGSFDKTIRKWNTASGNCVLKLERHSGMINQMLLFGSFLFSSSYDSTTVCWDLRTGEASRIFRGHKKSVLPLAYVEGSDHDSGGGTDLDRNKDSIVTGSMDRTARMWSVASATSLRTFRGHKDAILCIAVDRENKMLFTGSKDNTIRKWNLLTGDGLKVFKGHDGSVLCLQLHHRLLYSASGDTTARCWVAEFGDTTRKFVGHDHMISDMKFYQGIVFTGSGDSVVRAFDAKAGTLKRTFKGHKHPINCLVPHEETMLSGSYDGTVKIWNIRPLLKNRFGGSSSTLASSMRSSVTQQGNRSYDDSMSGSDVSMKRDTQINDRKTKRTTMELQNEISANRRQTKTRKPRSGRVAPMGEFRNGNNNSNLQEEFNTSYLSNRLQYLTEDEEYWAGSSNQSSTINLNIRENLDKSRNSSASSSGRRALEFLSARNDNASEFSQPMTNTSSRSSTNEFAKRELSDLQTKRPLTDSSNSVYQCSSDLALVDEEIQMCVFEGLETLSNTSGYRTADDNSSMLSAENPKKGTPVVKRALLREVAAISAKENRKSNSSSATSRISRIPTSTKSSKRQARSGRSNTSSASNNFPITSNHEQIKQMEKELLDLV